MPGHRAPRVAVVGGGAAGLMAALAAAGEGAAVTLLEAGERIGRKLLATGNGRCNLTNLRASPSHYHGDAALISGALAAAPPRTVLANFEMLGLLWREEEEGRVYPYSGQAAAVLDVLRLGCARAGVLIRCSQAVRGLKQANGGFLLTLEGGAALPVDHVVIACGGKASPKLGSNGGGYALLAGMGHRITPCYPALTQLCCAHPALKFLKGLRAQAGATLLIDGHAVRVERGEVLFTDYGLSGIAALGLARWVTPALEAGREVTVSLNLLPEYGDTRRRSLLKARLALFTAEPAGQFATGLFPRRIGEALCKEAGVPLDLPCAALGGTQTESLASLPGNWRFKVTGTQGFAQAQVTAGGAQGSQFDPATMQSRLVPGLYAAGEVLDVDGDCGGFNLQFAWASGLAAGQAAGRSMV